MKKQLHLLTLLFFSFCILSVYSQDAFITTWQTTAPNESITIPTFPGENYDYSIDWGDGTVDTNQTGNATHSYAAPGTQTISITGLFPRIYFNNTGDKSKILTVEQWGNQLWSSMNSAFSGCSNLDVVAIDTPDLSSVTELNAMFDRCQSLVGNISFNSWDTSNIQIMNFVFFGASLFNQPIGNWNLSNCVGINAMFSFATNFNQDLSSWDTTKIVGMNETFRSATSFNQDISNWNVSSVSQFTGMFSQANSFNQDLSSWDISSATNLRSMFFDALSFNQDLATWNIQNVIDAQNMFQNVGLTKANYDATLIGWATLDIGEAQIPSNITFNGGISQYCSSEAKRQELIDTFGWTITDGGKAADCPTIDFADAFITTWQTTAPNESITIPTFPGENYDYSIDWGDGTVDTNQTGNATHNFSDAGLHTVSILGSFPRIYFNNSGDKDKIRTIEQWGNIAWTSMENAFNGCTAMDVQATDIPDLSLVANMSGMFYRCASLVGNPSFNLWDTGNITNMISVFREAASFDQPIGDWNVANVTRMDGMFDGATIFNQSIGSWDVSKVANLGAMFSRTNSFNQNIGNWNVSNVTRMVSMFGNAKAFDQDIGSWNVAKVTDFTAMFQASVFNKDIGGWDVSAADNMSVMFFESEAFNQDISAWNVAKVQNMFAMFAAAASFDQDLGIWDISSITQMTNILNGAPLSIQNYDNTLIGWATLENGESQIPLNLSLGATNNQYCASEAKRQELIDTFGWTITDGGKAADCPTIDFVDAFITTWQTTTANESITIPTFPGETYDYSIDWGDGTVDTNQTGNATHSYAAPGTQTISITGLFPRIYFNNTGDKSKILTVEQWGNQLWSSMNSAFSGCSNLDVVAIDTPNLYSVTELNAMFERCQSLVGNISFNSWDVSNIIDMSNLFGYCQKFNQPINDWDVSNVENMEKMFFYSVFNQNIGFWDVSSVTNMSGMFGYNLVFNQPIGNWDVSSVTNMSAMFEGEIQLGYTNYQPFNQPIGSWNVSNVMDMSLMFKASSFNQNIGSWNVGNVTNMSQMFCQASFNQPINSWDVSNVTNMSEMFGIVMFFESSNPFNQDLGSWDVSKVTNMRAMFAYANLFDHDISSWNVSSVESMRRLFFGATSFDQSLANWNISSVKDMTEMFNQAGINSEYYDSTLLGWATLDTGETAIPNNITFNGGNSQYCASEAKRQELIDTFGWTITDGGKAADCPTIDFADAFITTWQTTAPNESITIPTFPGETYDYSIDWGDGTVDTNQTGDATHTYENAGTQTIGITGTFPRIFFNLGGDRLKIRTIEQWGNIAWSSMHSAFRGCSNLEVPALDVPNLSILTEMDYMFSGCFNLEGNTSFESWEVGNVTSMRQLFANTNFNQNIANWNVSKVEDMSSMFYQATSFNQQIGTWATSNVKFFTEMFRNATAFNQPIGNWNMGSAIRVDEMFQGATSFNQPIGQWNVGNVIDMSGMFEGATEFNQPLNNWNVSKVTNMRAMFNGATVFDQNLANWDISSLVSSAYFDPILGDQPDDTSAIDMFLNSGISSDNYDSLLNGWGTLDVSSGETQINYGITLNVDGVQYCNSDVIRNELINTYGWNILDGGKSTSCIDADFTNAFITTWETTSNNETITIPTNPSQSYNYTIDWGDGTVEQIEAGNASHIYASPGIQTIKITGLFPQLYIREYADKDKIRTVEQWGNIEWLSMNSAYQGASNLEVVATDVPDLSKVFSMDGMFLRCSNLKGNASFESWNVSNIGDMRNLFAETQFDQNLGSWDISSITQINTIFRGTTLSTENYDALLLGWSTLDSSETKIPSNITFGGGGSQYCFGETSRQNLIDNFGWAFNDGGLNCPESQAVLEPNGTLAINDTNGGDSDDSFTMSVSGGNLILGSNSSISITGDGVVQINENTVQIPLTGITNGLTLDGGGGNNTLVLDASLSLLGPENGLTLNNINVQLNGTGNLQLNALNVTSGDFDTNGLTTVVTTEANFFDDATLSGNGTINGLVNMNVDSNLAPGTSPGIITTGDLTLGNNNNDFEVNGPTPGTEHDQIVVTGTVTIVAGTTLNLLGGYANANSDEVVLIENDGTDPISGTFDGLGEGTAVSFGDFNGTISYVGGDGNDVTLLGTTVAGPLPNIVINEIMYNPIETGTDQTEYIELFNNSGFDVDISDWRLNDAIDFTFPSGTIFPDHSYFVIAGNEVAFQNFYGFAPNFEWSGTLANTGEVIELFNAASTIEDSVAYDDASPWPTLPDGDGPSLELQDPALDNNLGANWSASTGSRGTPGTMNGVDLDFVPPMLVSLDPMDDATDVPTNAILTMTFDEPMQWATNLDDIEIFDLTLNTLFGTLGENAPDIKFNANQISIDPAANFNPNTEYEVRIGNNSFVDASGNPFSGIPSLGWTFTTAANPQTAGLRVIQYNDANQDGDDNEVSFSSLTGETLIGWEFTVYDSQGNLVASGVTSEGNMVSDSGIQINFEDLSWNETYTICQTTQPGWVNTDPGAGSNPDPENLGRPCKTVNLTGVSTFTFLTFGSYVDGPTCNLTIDTQPEDVVICEGPNTYSFTMAASGTGTISYSWEVSTNDGATWTQMMVQNSNSVTLSDISKDQDGNQYRVIVTSDNNTPNDNTDDCSVISNVATLTVNPLLEIPEIKIENTTCLMKGAAVISNYAAEMEYTFLPTGPMVIDTGSITGFILDTVYSVTIKDLNTGCESESMEFSVGSWQEITCSIVQDVFATDHVTPNGVATVDAVGGSGPYTYLWDNGETAQKATSLTYGIHSVTVTDANGCETTCQIDIAKELYCWTNLIQNQSYNGGKDGSARVRGNGGYRPYTFLWEDGSTGEVNDHLSAGTHYVTITDATGATSQCSVTLSEPNEGNCTDLTCSVDQDVLATDHITPDGVATVTPMGGSGHYTYLWDNGETTQRATTLTYGMHTVKVTDANGCETTCQIDIAKELYCWTSLIQNLSYNGGKDGSARVRGNGGYRPYTFLWEDGSTGEVNDHLSAGTHYVTITDATGATSQCSVTLSEPNEGNCTDLTCSVDQDVLATDHITPDGVATVTPMGGSGHYTYLWDNGETTQRATTLTYGMHTVKVTDANGCETTCQIDIAKELYCWTNLIQNVSYNGGKDGSARVRGNGGHRPYTFLWEDGSTGEVNDHLSAGTHYVTITDATGATSQCSVTLSEPNAIEVCDGIDNDGDGEIDEGFDADYDGIANCFDLCPNGDDSLDKDGDGTPDACDVEECDGVDNDGDGYTDEGFDSDMDGTADCLDDCDNNLDTDQDGVPDCLDKCPGYDDNLDWDGDGTPDGCDVEVCDGIDNDGDGEIDEDVILPMVEFVAFGEIGIDAGILYNLSGGSPDSGTYSGPGVNDNEDGTYTFDPAAAGLGEHTLTYTYESENGCSNFATDLIEVVDAAPVVVLINEFQPNPLGTDPSTQMIELKGPSGQAFSGWLVILDSDSGTSSGGVNDVEQISGTFDANGLLTVSIPDVENPSFTLILTDNYQDGVDDFDSDNDGQLDADISNLGNIVDAIGIPDISGDESFLYGTQLGGDDFKFTGAEPMLIFRDSNTDAWFAINDHTSGMAYDIDANPYTFSSFSGNLEAPTFGMVNPFLVTTARTFQMEVWPNPTVEILNLEVPKSSGIIRFDLYDSSGKLVKSVPGNAWNLQQIDVRSLESGVYIIRANGSSSNNMIKKFIKR